MLFIKKIFSPVTFGAYEPPPPEGWQGVSNNMQVQGRAFESELWSHLYHYKERYSIWELPISLQYVMKQEAPYLSNAPYKERVATVQM